MLSLLLFVINNENKFKINFDVYVCTLYITYVCMYTHTYTYVCLCVCVCVCVCMYVHMCVGVKTRHNITFTKFDQTYHSIKKESTQLE